MNDLDTGLRRAKDAADQLVDRLAIRSKEAAERLVDAAASAGKELAGVATDALAGKMKVTASRVIDTVAELGLALKGSPNREQVSFAAADGIHQSSYQIEGAV